MFFGYGIIISENQKKKMKGMDLIMKNLKEELNYGKKGITLISLVVTIIVLLILAGVTIATLTGNNGFLTRASDSKEKTEEAQIKENLGIAITTAQIGNNGYQELNQNNLQDALDDQFGKGIAIVTDTQNGSFIIKLENKEYEISSSGNISEIQIINDATPGTLAGNGTETEPYLIESIEDLVFFADDVSNGNTYQNEYVKLVYSLNFCADSSYSNPNIENFFGYDGKLKDALTSGDGFRGIGSRPQNENSNFWGNFNGNGCIISNLFINDSQTEESGVGLFSYNYGTIINIGLKNVNITENYIPPTGSRTCFVGGLVGRNNGGKISNVYVSGNISSKLSEEGYPYAAIRTGGIVGQVTDSILENSYNLSNVNIKGFSKSDGMPNLGGLAGSLSFNASLINSYNIGYIDNSQNQEGIIVAGSIVGSISQSSATITNCYYLQSTYSTGIGDNHGTADNKENLVKSSDYMKSDEFLNLLGNNFKKDSQNINNGYPILNWQ